MGLTRFREIENGIFSANGLKAQGTRVIAFGVGAGVNQSGQNLRSISGTTLNSDYFQTTDYATAGNQLRPLALGACSGTISVIKQVIPPGGTTATAAPDARLDVRCDHVHQRRHDQSGQRSDRCHRWGQLQPHLPGRDHPRSDHRDRDPEAQLHPRPTGWLSTPRADVSTPIHSRHGHQQRDPRVLGRRRPSGAISCTVYNQAPNPPATIQVNKQWTVNGVTFADGNQPTGLSAQPTLNGTPALFGSVVSGFIQASRSRSARR